ncbi:MAG TPA: flagellar biosynthetic protein FliR [Terriglobia bacterium]|nr:flagellar biosynthetic protein FliR [Terriglobia bacterium]
MKSISLAIPYFYLLHVLIISVRVGGTLLFAPIWGYPGLPQYLRVMLVFSIAVGVSAVTPFNIQAYSNPGLVLPTEFLIGLLLSMGIRIAFAGLNMGGHIVSHHMGFSAVQAIDPQTMNRSALMSGYLTMLGFVMILASNQHHTLFRALANSYVAFPVGSSVTTGQWFQTLIEASSQIFVIGWKIALPVFIATFCIELAVGFIARMQPGLNTMVVTAPLKLLVGLMVFGASLAFIPRVIGTMLETMILRK